VIPLSGEVTAAFKNLAKSLPVGLKRSLYQKVVIRVVEGWQVRERRVNDVHPRVNGALKFPLGCITGTRNATPDSAFEKLDKMALMLRLRVWRR